MKTTGMWTRDDGYRTFGALLPAQDAENACRLADQVATAMGLTVHDGAHWLWPPTSQRPNAAPLHQLRLERHWENLGVGEVGYLGRCSCGWDDPAGLTGRPIDAYGQWESHLIEEGVLE